MRVAVLGSTGSIGTQALDCLKNLGIKPVALTAAGNNIDLLEKQIRDFSPEIVCVENGDAANTLRQRLNDIKTEIRIGSEWLFDLIDCDTVVNGIVGVAGLRPTLAAARKGCRIALANKESLVVAGSIVTAESKKHHAKIIPTDSEHSAIFQCLNGINPTSEDVSLVGERVKRLILTASGGAFFGKTTQELEAVTANAALFHPTWRMGKKITVDCATLMNKGFEVMEAAHLFGVPEDRIDILVHRESVVHSMIELYDSSVLAQLAVPDMRLAIQYALTYPNHSPSCASRLDFTALPPLTFTEYDRSTFTAPELCRQVFRQGGTAPAILNAANEIAVSAFLRGDIPFTHIIVFSEKMLNKYEIKYNPSLDEILETDMLIRKEKTE